MKLGISKVFIVGVFCVPSFAAPAASAPDLSPDGVIQAAIGRVERAANADDARRQMDELVALGEREPAELVGQLVWYSAQHQGDRRARAIVGRAFSRLGAPKDVVVTALVTHLDDRDAAVRGDVRELLKGYEDRSATRPPDFSTYRAIIEDDVRHGREPRASLVELMYQSDAGTALLTMVRAYQLREPGEIKPILWAEHVVSDLLWKRRYGFAGANAVDAAALQQVELMSRHPRWWARLYAAEVVRTHPELGAAGMVDRLAGDGNGLVRAAGLAAKAKQSNSKATQ